MCAGAAMTECQAWSRLEGVLERLGEVENGGVMLVVRDDTLLHKLHTHLHRQLLWARDAGKRPQIFEICRM